MTPSERAKALAARPAENRKQILAKVREYQSLSPTQRELRLQVTELRWYLWPLMNSYSSNRTARLEHIPAAVRPQVEERLAAWDQLAPGVQKELLTNEATIRYFTEMSAATGQQRTNLLKNISPARQAMLEAGVRQIQAMPSEAREKLMARFNQFFDLTPGEKAKALGTLSEPERRQIDRTLRKFAELSPEKRLQCLRSMQKFVSLNVSERQQFLKNAERWKLMTPEQRQAWCALVTKVSVLPPMPPGINSPPLPPVPKIPAVRAARPAAAVATNQN